MDLFLSSTKYYAAVNDVAESPTAISFSSLTVVPENSSWSQSFGTISLVDEDPVGYKKSKLLQGLMQNILRWAAGTYTTI